jgi:hypothetical protein
MNGENGYIYLRVRMYIYICTYVIILILNIVIWTCIHMCIYIYIYICLYVMYDIGGQRNEWRKWIHLFEGIFVRIYICMYVIILINRVIWIHIRMCINICICLYVWCWRAKKWTEEKDTFIWKYMSMLCFFFKIFRIIHKIFNRRGEESWCKNLLIKYIWNVYTYDKYLYMWTFMFIIYMKVYTCVGVENEW